MNTFLALSVLGSLVFTISLIILITLFGIPKSLSQSFYNLGGRDGKGYLFYLMILSTVFLLIFPLVEAAQAAGFICGASLLFVGAAAAFKDDKTAKWIHISSALLSFVMAVVTLLKIGELICVAPITLLVIILGVATMTIKDCKIFWLEMIPMYSIFTGLIAYFS